MSDQSTQDNPNTSHQGSVSSYIVGFIISLLLTFVPYYIVKHQVIDNTPLLIAVIALALVQMVVQMVFFLHLGRGPKPLYNIVFLGATSGMILLVVGASILIMNSLYGKMSPEEAALHLAQNENIAEISGIKTGACQGNRDNHVVTIGNGLAISHVEAKRCDTLTIKSGDGLAHELMFGSYNNPTSYGGVHEIFVRNDRAKIITLNEVGDFSFHDHNNPAISGFFSVVNRDSPHH